MVVEICAGIDTRIARAQLVAITAMPPPIHSLLAAV
jgi:hypothetical protein